MKFYHLIFLAPALLCGNAFAKSHYRDVEWTVRANATGNNFEVTMTLISSNGHKTVFKPGYGGAKWKAFRFECPALISFDRGFGRYKVNTELTATDSLLVTAISEQYGIHSSFKIPTFQCKTLKLNNPEINYGSTVPLVWTMIMTNGLELPVDPKWVDLSVLENQSDPIVTFDDNMLSLMTAKPVKSARVKFVHKLTGEAVIDYELQVNYPAVCSIDFSGTTGRAGRSGTSGSQNSESGTSGDNGENGGDAESLKVFIRPYTGETFQNLLEVTVVTEKGRRRRMYISDNAPHIEIVATGGNGGNGGNGGSGSYGSSDSDGESVRGGNAGHGGSGGHGGNGGDVLIIVREDVQQPERFVKILNKGGEAGKGGYSGRPGIGTTIFRYDNGNKGTEGQNGHEGQAGAFMGIRSLNAEEFGQALKEAGW